MKKLVLFLALALSSAAMAFTVNGDKISDNKGNSIEKKVYNRIVVLDPAAVEGIFLVGGENKITAIADTSMTPIWPYEKTKKLPNTGNIRKPSLEKVLSFRPDLVIVGEMIEGFGDSLKEKGIKVLVGGSQTLTDIIGDIEVYGALTGNEKNAADRTAEYKDKLSKIQKEIADNPLKIKGVFLFSTTPMMAFTEKSLPGEIFKTLGIENIAQGLPGNRPILSQEYMITKNPDLIVTSMGVVDKNEVIKSNPVISSTTAGKKGNLIVLSSDRILRSTPRIIDALEDLHREILSAK